MWFNTKIERTDGPSREEGGVAKKLATLKKPKRSEWPSADKLSALATQLLRANGFTAAESDLYLPKRA
jgi:regulator of sirC expression with transglutaminase-like and TPR domain